MNSPSQFTLSGELALRRDDIDARAVAVPERRGKARIRYGFPTRAWGIDADGEAFDVDCALDNISSSGLYLRMPRQLKPGIDINVVVRFVKTQDSGVTAVLNCEVLRDEVQPDGQHGIAMAIRKYHFVDAQVAGSSAK